MANVGQILTDEEVGSIPGWPKGSTMPILAQLVLRGCEAEIIRAAQLQIKETQRTREPYTIEPPVRRDNIVTHPKDMFILRNAPVKTLDGFMLEVVQAREPQTGAVTLASELPKSAYGVDLVTGIVRLYYSVPLDPSVWPYPLSLDPNNMWPFAGSFPPGVDGLLATYISASAEIPDDLKLIALMVVARTWKRFQNQDWEIASTSLAGSSTAYLNVQFTNRELGTIRKFQRGVFPSFH